MNNALGFPLLSLVLWLPTIGALALLLVPRDQAQTARLIALLASGAAFVASLGLLAAPMTADAQLYFVDRVAWVPAWGIEYLVGIDGISLWLVLLTTFLTPVTLLSTWDTVHARVRSFQVLMLLLETAMLGVFVAQDLFLFYVFWELTLIPMALLIGIWGGPQRREAAVKFFIYTFAGSVLMLIGIIALYLLHGQATSQYTFNLPAITASLDTGALNLSQNLEVGLFGLFFFAFAIKVPLWPFHTWLPLAHVEAPTAGSVILAGVLLKLGGYGFIRFNLQLFPLASNILAPWIGLLALIGIVYGAWVSYGQSDMKKLVAYSSVSHLGFVMLGIFALNQVGISGAILQMVNHGLSTGALFLVVGIVYERLHTRELAAFSGIWKVLPLYGALSLVTVLSSVGLPGLNGFIGEFTIMQGAFTSTVLGWAYVAPAVLGVVLAATYLMRMYRGAFMGEPNEQSAKLAPLHTREIVTLVLLIVPMVVIGLYPNLILGGMQEAVAQAADRLGANLTALR